MFLEFITSKEIFPEDSDEDVATDESEGEVEDSQTNVPDAAPQAEVALGAEVL